MTALETAVESAANKTAAATADPAEDPDPLDEFAAIAHQLSKTGSAYITVPKVQPEELFTYNEIVTVDDGRTAIVDGERPLTLDDGTLVVSVRLVEPDGTIAGWRDTVLIEASKLTSTGNVAEWAADTPENVTPGGEHDVLVTA